MTSKALTTIDDGFVHNRHCAICGAEPLRIVRVEGFPDHVACDACGSAFLVEDGGSRVMYGKIPEAYPATRRFALREWAWPDAIENRAKAERPSAAPRAEAVAPPSVPPPPARPPEPGWPDETPPLEEVPSLEGEPEAEAEPAPTPYRPYWAEAIEPPPAAKPSPPAGEAVPAPAAGGAPSPPPSPPVALPVGEPPVGQRHRVVIRGERVAFLSKHCAHCLRSPAPGRLAVVAPWPQAGKPRRRRAMTFTVHLCEDCHKRASARTEGERGARLQAHLLSTLIALGLLIASLATGLVDVRSDLLVRLLVIGMILIVGYGVPAIVLLGRVGRQPPSRDAVFVRSTLVIEPEADGSEAAFAWRNPHYAQLFHQANRERAVGGVTPVADLTT